MGEKKVELEFERETKRMVRYKDETEGFGTMYIPKSIFENGPPEVITLTVSWD